MSDDTKPGKKRTVLDNALKEHSNVFQFARNASARSMLLLLCERAVSEQIGCLRGPGVLCLAAKTWKTHVTAFQHSYSGRNLFLDL